MLSPAGAAASVDPQNALHAYARGRLADGDGALRIAVDSYRAALASAPDSAAIARRAYAQAIESGDGTLALRSALLLEAQGQLPRDGTLLRAGDALVRKDWGLASALADRMVEEGNFAFVAPFLRSWIAAGQGRHVAPVVEGGSSFASLGQRYLDEQTALLALSRGDVDAARPAIRRALGIGRRDGAAQRILLANQLAAAGDRAGALGLLPEGAATFAVARAQVGKARVTRRGAMTPAQGFARLLARLATDIAADEAGMALGLRLARIAGFIDPQGADVRVEAAGLLVAGGYADAAMLDLAKVVPSSAYAPLAQAVQVDALAEAGRGDEALMLARQLAAAPDAEAEQWVRLGRLLAERRDFTGAATAFRTAQAAYPEAGVPWTLLLFEGSALEQAQQWDAARPVLERAARIAPDEPVILNYLGYAQVERRQNVAGALALIERARALKPRDAAIADSLGWAHYVTGNVASAIPVLEQAAAGAPGDPTINEHLGDALWTAGRRFEARYAWSAAAVQANGVAATRLAAKNKEGLKPEYAAP